MKWRDDSMMLGKQFHVTRDYFPFMAGEVREVYNADFCKAGGGLWTSTYDEKKGSAWVQWSLCEGFNVPEGELWNGVILTPSEDARILVVDTVMDLKRIINEYPLKTDIPSRIMAMLDFERMAEDYDAFHLTENGQYETRHSRPGLYSWDVESTHWFRWKFDKVEEVKRKRWEIVDE